MQHYYSHGKLLLTAEYVVLDGAKALAIPTKFGQKLTVEDIAEHKIIWTSIDYQGNIWFEEEYRIKNKEVSLFIEKNNPISERLRDILNAAIKLNPAFLEGRTGFKIASTLEFPNDWGLGSSSTLLNNIAQWANIDAFELSNATFGGSGYDIACAQNDSAIVYQLNDSKPFIENILFNKTFENHLFFVHLNRKQDSRDSIKTYRENKLDSNTFISQVNTLTATFTTSESIGDFNDLIETHERLIGEITNQTPIKKRLFKDFKNQIKSLGGWNGDFVLATGEREYVETYFKSRGYNTIVSFKDMIL